MEKWICYLVYWSYCVLLLLFSSYVFRPVNFHYCLFKHWMEMARRSVEAITITSIDKNYMKRSWMQIYQVFNAKMKPYNWIWAVGEFCCFVWAYEFLWIYLNRHCDVVVAAVAIVVVSSLHKQHHWITKEKNESYSFACQFDGRVTMAIQSAHKCANHSVGQPSYWILSKRISETKWNLMKNSYFSFYLTFLMS